MTAASPAFPSPLISAEQLRQRLHQTFVVDCSHDLAAPDAGAAAFEKTKRETGETQKKTKRA